MSMNMSRRIFAAVMGLTLFAGTLPTAGCAENPVVIMNTVIDAANSILAVAEPNAPWAAQLKSATTALEGAEATWQNGGSVQVVIDALNTVEAVLAAIPVTAQYSPLVAVLVAGVESVLAVLYPSSQAAALHLRALVGNPYVGRARLHQPHVFQTHRGAFVEQWNHTADTLGYGKSAHIAYFGK